mgnify:CR=1 FL=1
MKNKVKVLALTTAVLASSAHAEITFNGFANIVAGQTTSKNDSLYGYTNDIDFKQDSLFALQASSDLGEGLSVTAQIISRGSDDWDPKFEWAYLTYQPNDNLRILAGRQRVPFYMYSDFLDVSYAYPWIRPPQGVYSLITDTFDGLGGIYNWQTGELDHTIHAIYGRTQDTQDLLGDSVDLDFKGMTGIAYTFNRDWLTLRAGYFQADLNMPIASIELLGNGWKAAGFTDIGDNVLVEEDRASFIEVGFQVDYDNFLVIGEYTKLDIKDTMFPEEDSYYVMGGYRYNEFLFHLTYGKDDDSLDNFVSHVPTGVDPGLDVLIGGTSGFIASQQADSKYYTAGMRWNFHDSASFKFEFTDYTDSQFGNDASLIRTAIVTVF